MALAAVSACAESLPTALQKACTGGARELERLLVQGTVDSQSHTSRRFALTALSYLRQVTPTMAPALLAACQDVTIVQRDALEAAKHFQLVEGAPVPLLPQRLRAKASVPPMAWHNCSVCWEPTPHPKLCAMTSSLRLGLLCNTLTVRRK